MRKSIQLDTVFDGWAEWGMNPPQGRLCMCASLCFVTVKRIVNLEMERSFHCM